MVLGDCVCGEECVCVCVCGWVGGWVVAPNTDSIVNEMALVRQNTNSVDLLRSGEGMCLLCQRHPVRTLWQTERRLGLLCGS